MSDPREPINGSHYIERLAYEAATDARLAIGISWIDNGDGAWRVEVEDIGTYYGGTVWEAARDALAGLRARQEEEAS